MNNELLNLAALAIMIIGGVNVGLEGLLNLNIITFIFGGLSIAARLIYILIGASAVYTALIKLNIVK